jgi:alpha-tubulin suppressor-like RCC1 family protein
VVGLGSGVVTIAAGPSHACALTRGGAAKCWGDNTWDKLGNVGDGRTPVTVSRPTSGIVAIAAGWGHSCLLTKGGAVKCWGLNNEGQVGDGTTVDRFQPVDVAGLDRGVIAIAAGSLHSCALISGGAVKCWGANGVGSLGDGTQTRRTTPVSVMGLASGVVAITAKSGHSCATTRDGAAKCWGLNFLGQLGNGAQRNRVFPVDVTGLSSGVVAITAGSSHSCALTISGVVKCWGYNSTGQIGDGTTTIRRTPATVSGFAALVRSRTWISTRTLGLGAHGLRATYPGDTLHGASSGTLAQTVVD